jgi:pyruvate formate lyase activating enzyme
MNPVPQFFGPEKADGTLDCCLCPRRCSIPGGRFGACGVRGNKNGRALIPFYGYISALSLDPIEKKPLYHFRPGSEILSLGFTGCNLRCPFCQNWRISQNPEAPARRMEPGEVIAALKREEARSGREAQIAYTYSEPLVHAEFLLDCMGLARKEGIANVLVTNGCVNAGAARRILSLTDAANIDLKSFSAETYARILAGAPASGAAIGNGALEAVLEFIRLAFSMGVHIEITTLVVPGLNDGAEELDAIANFIASLSPNIPLHLSAYHPDYRWDAPPTDPALLLGMAEQAQKKLRYVYTGNIATGKQGQRFTRTPCPRCGAVLVKRQGYSVDSSGLAPPKEGPGKRYICAACGAETPIAAPFAMR